MIVKNLWRRKTRTLLTLLGIAVGVAAVVALSAFGEGIASGVGLNRLFVLVPDFGSFLTPIYSQAMFFKVLVLALGLGSIGGLYPAWRAAGLRPIEALKYE